MGKGSEQGIAGAIKLMAQAINLGFQAVVAALAPLDRIAACLESKDGKNAKKE